MYKTFLGTWVRIIDNNAERFRVQRLEIEKLTLRHIGKATYG